MLKPTVHARVEITRILSHTLPHTPSYTCVHAPTYIHMRSLTHMRSLSSFSLSFSATSLVAFSHSLFTRSNVFHQVPSSYFRTLSRRGTVLASRVAYLTNSRFKCDFGVYVKCVCVNARIKCVHIGTRARPLFSFKIHNYKRLVSHTFYM